jgi:hypothetical protein
MSVSWPYSPTNERILNGSREPVADVQASGHVRGWRGYHEQTLGFGSAVGIENGFEEALLVPPVVPGSFNSDWIVASSHGS